MPRKSGLYFFTAATATVKLPENKLLGVHPEKSSSEMQIVLCNHCFSQMLPQKMHLNYSMHFSCLLFKINSSYCLKKYEFFFGGGEKPSKYNPELGREIPMFRAKDRRANDIFISNADRGRQLVLQEAHPSIDKI